MKTRLLRFIECKNCYADFSLCIFTKENNEIKDGMLVCPKCKQHYYEYFAPDWAITIKGIKETAPIKFLKPKHIWDKSKIGWDG